MGEGYLSGTDPPPSTDDAFNGSRMMRGSYRRLVDQPPVSAEKPRKRVNTGYLQTPFGGKIRKNACNSPRGKRLPAARRAEKKNMMTAACRDRESPFYTRMTADI